jgi:hypothetical protein
LISTGITLFDPFSVACPTSQLHSASYSTTSTAGGTGFAGIAGARHTLRFSSGATNRTALIALSITFITFSQLVITRFDLILQALEAIPSVRIILLNTSFYLIGYDALKDGG